MNASDTKDLPIGVFDSGVGGLTVLKAIRETLPNENLVYLGDTARLPYGTKSPASISRYACQATTHLQQSNIKLLVVACNTASAVALEALREQMLQYYRVPTERVAAITNAVANHLSAESFMRRDCGMTDLF